MPRLELDSPRLFLPLILLAAAALLVLRWDALSVWMARSLEWREVRTLEIVEKESWPLVQTSVNATEGSGWLAYRFYHWAYEEGGSGRRERAWGFVWAAVALAAAAGYFLAAARAWRGAPVALGALLALAGSAWPALALGIGPTALLPAFWLLWLLWLGHFLSRPGVATIALGCVVAAVVVHAHMLLLWLVPLTLLLAWVLLALPQAGEVMGLGARLRRGFWAVFFVLGAAAVSVGPALLRAYALRPIGFTLKSPGADLDALLRYLFQAPWPRTWAIALGALFSLYGFLLLFSRERRATLLWTLAWPLFGFLAAKLRWGDLAEAESAALEALPMLEWATPILAATGLCEAARRAAARLSAPRLRFALAGLLALALAGFVLASPGPRPPRNPDWEGLADFLLYRAAPEDRILLFGPDYLFHPSQYACILAPFRDTPLLPRLSRFPASASLLRHLASETPRLWVLRFEAADWPMTVKYEMETRAEFKGSFSGVQLYEFPTAAYGHYVSGMRTQWRPKVFDLAALGQAAGLEIVRQEDLPLLYLRTGARLEIELAVEKAGAYNLRLFVASVATGSGTLDFSINDVLIHSARLAERRNILPSDFSLYFHEGSTRLTLEAGEGGRFLLSKMEIGRNRVGLLPDIRHPRDIVFGQSLRFLGFSLSSDVAAPGGAVEVSYFWESMRRLEEPLQIIMRCDHLAPDGRFHRFSNDHLFMAGLVEPDSLEPGEVLRETRVIEVPYDAPELPYRMMLGVVSERGLGTFRRDRALSPPSKFLGVFDHEADRIQVGMIEVARDQKSRFILPRPMPRDPLIFRFTPEIDFIGFDLNRTALADAVRFEVSLYFHCLSPLRRSYNVVTTVTGPGSRIVAQDAHEPCGRGFYPTSLWEAGQKIRDTFSLDVPTAEADRVDLNIALIERYPEPGRPPRQLGKMIQLRDFGLRMRDEP